MSGSQHVPHSKDVDGKKGPGKTDLKIQPEESASQIEKQAGENPTTTANLPPAVQLPPNLLQLAALQFTTTQAGEPQLTTEEKLAAPTDTNVAASMQSGKKETTGAAALRDPKSGTSAVTTPVQESLPAQALASSSEEVPISADTPQVIAAQVTVSHLQGPFPWTRRPVAPETAPAAEIQPLIAPTEISAVVVASDPFGKARGEVRPGPSPDETRPAPAAALNGAREVPKVAFSETRIAPEATFSEARPQLIKTSAVFSHRPAPAAVASDPFGKATGEVRPGLSPDETGKALEPASTEVRRAPEAALNEANKMPETAFSEARPQLSNATVRILHHPPASQTFSSKSPVLEAKPLLSPEGTKVNQPSAKAQNSTTEKSTCAAQTSGPKPLPSEPVAAEPVQLEPDTPLPPQRIQAAKSEEAANNEGSLPPIADESASGVSGAAEAPLRHFAETGTAEKTQRTAAASQATPESREGPGKKSSASILPDAVSSREVSAQAGFTREAGTTVVVPAEGASAPPVHEKVSEARAVPKTQQMLDAAPVVATTPPGARISAEPGGEVQMRVGIRTTAFGAVEIYTSVHQNQVGLAVHGERGLAQWFSTEVQNIESGLKDHRLNLTTVELDGKSTGLQTATSSHHHHESQHNFSAMTRSWSSAMPELTQEIEPTEVATPDLSVGSGENRVSIRI
ncbi:MAG: hypothetical protein HY233_09380 [Acidobacteriales bacterium]|nr:hypothetical protein [Candidatus Koribacter versatilis]MBI3646159.1 hypothetical protein [Terriglobales bacterium]